MGQLELLTVLRRLTTLVIIWVSLLGAALPAFACSLAAAENDCCGRSGTSSPCTIGTAFTQQADALRVPCCAAGQAASTDIAMDSGRASNERSQHPSTSPDALFIVTSRMGWASLRAPAEVALLILPPRTDAALTYLHTARLRL